MKAKRGCGLLPWLVAAVSVLMFRPGMVFADDSAVTEMSLALNAGESYVINNVSPGDTPAVKVITNPHALVVHNEEPGKIVLLGAEAGEWKISIKTGAGAKVDYDVTVKSVANAYDINHPGTSPAAIAGTGASTGTAAPVAARLDAGAGPVDTSSTSTSMVGGSASSSSAVSSSGSSREALREARRP